MKEEFEEFLSQKTSQYFSEQGLLHDSVLYSLLAPGKRIRPLLVLGMSRALGAKEERAHICGVAVEMVHAYSLIHDDLPSMDNDDFRRGRPTNHKVYGEATAILAGDCLLSTAPELLLKELSKAGMDSRNITELTALLMEASRKMVQGQALDMKYGEEDLSSLDTEEKAHILKTIHRLKTGALINWSCVAGLYCLNDQEKIQKNLRQVEKVGQGLGLLFQMVDDVLDVTSSLQDLGKTPGKDEATGKLTYTNLFGLAGARERARELAGEIRQELKQLPGSDWDMVMSVVDSLELKLK